MEDATEAVIHQILDFDINVAICVSEIFINLAFDNRRPDIFFFM